MKKIVYIAVESKLREFNAKLLLTTELVNRGYLVYIGRHDKIRKMAIEGEPGILIDKDFSAARVEPWNSVHKNGGKVYAWDEEGIVNLSRDVYLKLRVDDAAMDIVDKIFLWGTVQKADMISKYPETVDKMYIVGNPRFDLASIKAGKIFYHDRVNQLQKKYGKFILVNTSFGPVKKEGIDHYVSVVKAHSNMIDENTESRIIRYRENRAKMLPLFLEGIKYLAQHVDNVIILRPHPGENHEIYETFFSECKNVIICRKDEANIWNLAAALVIHSGSTTAAESYCNRRVNILFQPLSMLNIQNDFPNNLSECIETKEQLVDYIKNYLTNPSTVEKAFFNKSKDAILESKIHRETKLSAKLIADLFEANDYEADKPKYKYKIAVREQLRCLKHAVLRKVNYKDEAKFSFTSLKEIEKFCAGAMQLLNNRNQKISVKRIEMDVFEVK